MALPLQLVLNLLYFTVAYSKLNKTVIITAHPAKKYEPNWASLDTRPTPEWYDKAKVGIMLHWGVYSVPSFGPESNPSSEWFWAYWKANSKDYVEYMNNNYPASFSYQDFANDFTAEFFDPYQWAEIFESAGARYVVLTSKHHEGYTLWPSTHSFGWNAKDIGPHRDLIDDLSSAIRNKTNLHFGLYYSLYEWYNPLYISDKKAGFKIDYYITSKEIPEMVYLINNYKPEIFWVDGDWEANDTYWKSTEFLAWLYNESPVKNTVLVNDRWGIGIPCSHGDFYSCTDRFYPGQLQSHKWEGTMTIDKLSWGYRRNAQSKDIMLLYDIIKQIVITVSCGGNILINVGPTKEGTIAPIYEERLRSIGKWLNINGEAIYETVPWKYQNDTINENVWYTSKGRTVYAITLKWPENNILVIAAVSSLFTTNNPVVSLIGSGKVLEWTLDGTGVSIYLKNKCKNVDALVWVIKIEIEE